MYDLYKDSIYTTRTTTSRSREVVVGSIGGGGGAIITPRAYCIWTTSFSRVRVVVIRKIECCGIGEETVRRREHIIINWQQ